MKLIDLLRPSTRRPVRPRISRRPARKPHAEPLEGRTLLSYGYGWTQVLGSAYSEPANAVATDSAGNVYLTGGFEGTVDFQPRDPSTAADTLTSHPAASDPSGATTTEDIFVAKYDPSGGLLWVRGFGSSTAGVGEEGRGMAVDSGGNVYVTGDCGTAGVQFGATVVATPDGGFRAKLDPNGVVLWANDTFSRAGYQKIDIDAAGNVYTLGGFGGTVDFDLSNGSTTADTLTAVNMPNIYLTKNAPDGTFQWVKRIAYDSSGAGLGLDVAGGSVLLTGRFAGTVDFDPGPATQNLTTSTEDTAFLLKLDLNGAYQWAFALPSSRYQLSVGRDVAIDDVGSVYTTGIFTGTVDFDPGKGKTSLTSQGAADSYIAKYSASGAFQWARALGGTADQSAQSLALDGARNVTTTGWFKGTADFDPGAGTVNRTATGTDPIKADIYVSKLDPNGNFLGVATFGGSDFDWGQDVAVDGSGNTYAAGFVRSTSVDFDPTSGVDLKIIDHPDAAFLTKLTWTSAAPLRASSITPAAIRQTLTATQARPALAQALAYWRAHGADTSALGQIDIAIADLGGDRLGEASGSTITLDDNAAGWGWSGARSRRGMAGRMDLLSALTHEVGHLLGHNHAEGGVMAETLAPGVRQALPVDSTHGHATTITARGAVPSRVGGLSAHGHHRVRHMRTAPPK